MSGRIGRYTYKNESVLKEFLGKYQQDDSNESEQTVKKLLQEEKNVKS